MSRLELGKEVNLEEELKLLLLLEKVGDVSLFSLRFVCLYIYFLFLFRFILAYMVEVQKILVQGRASQKNS